MTDEGMTDWEQCRPGVLNPGLHDQWHWDEAEPTAPASCPVTTSSPPSWWQEMAAAHEVKHTRKRGQLNLL